MTVLVGMKISIREARAGDLPAIKEMDRDVVLFVAGLDSAKDLAEVSKRHEEIFERWFSISEQKVFIAFDEAKPEAILGFVWLINNSEQFTGIPYCFVMDLGAREGHRRQGIGKALMGRAMEYTKSTGCDRLKLMVNARNKNAIRFYRQLGFELEDLYMKKKV